MSFFMMGRSKWVPILILSIFLVFFLSSLPMVAGPNDPKYVWILEDGSCFPDGFLTKSGDTYYMEKDIPQIAIWKSDVKINGWGHTLNIHSRGYTGSGTWTLGGPDRLEFRNLTMKGWGPGKASMFLGARLSSSPSNDIILENCTLIDCGFGVFGNNASINNNKVVNGSLSVFQPWSPGNSTIFNNELYNSSIAAGLNKVFVCGNLVDSGVGSGIILDSTSECYVIGNTVLHTSKGENIQYYRHHRGDGIYSIRSIFNVIAANRILGNAGSGINIDSPMANDSVNVVWGNVITSNEIGFNLSTSLEDYQTINVAFNNNFEDHPGGHTSGLWHPGFWDVGNESISAGEIPDVFENYIPEAKRASVRGAFNSIEEDISWLIEDFIQDTPLKSGISLENVTAYLETGNEDLWYGNFWDDHTSPDVQSPIGVVDIERAMNPMNIDNYPLTNRFILDNYYDDDDFDGVADYLEGLVENVYGGGRGDGNGDGTNDNDQVDVASLSTMGKRRGFATLNTSEGELVNVTARPAPPQHSENMPYGAFAFEVHGVPAGQSVELSLYLPLDNDLDQLWKEIEGTWREIENAVFSPSGDKMRISFRITDNGPLDGNGLDGIITDDFAPAFGIPEVFYPGSVVLLCILVIGCRRPNFLT